MDGRTQREEESIGLKASGVSRVDEPRLPSPVFRCEKTSAHVAQLVEHVLGKDEVTSSILVVGSNRNRRKA